MKNKYFVLFVLCCAVLMGVLTLTNPDVLGVSPPPIYEVSVIIRGRPSEYWSIARQGMEQAAYEMNVVFSYVTLSKDNDVQEQIDMILREKQSGADAIVLAAANPSVLEGEMEKLIEGVPIITFESTADSDRIVAYVAPDNKGMAEYLARMVLTSMGTENKKVVLLDNDLRCSAIAERKEAFLTGMQDNGYMPEIWHISYDNLRSPDYLAALISDVDPQIIVGLDQNALLAIGQAVKLLQGKEQDLPDIEVYGIGSSLEVVPFLEKGIITASIVPNDYNMGYLSIQKAVEAASQKNIEPSPFIEAKVINAHNMYNEENQQLLFPFIR